MRKVLSSHSTPTTYLLMKSRFDYAAATPSISCRNAVHKYARLIALKAVAAVPHVARCHTRTHTPTGGAHNDDLIARWPSPFYIIKGWLDVLKRLTYLRDGFPRRLTSRCQFVLI